MTTPEQRARETIDDLLTAAGWQVQDRAALNLGAGRGVAVREFPLKDGFADYLLFVDRKAVGAVEAKAEGMPLSGIETQSEKYGAGLRENMPAWRKPLPFLYESTGVETYFSNGLEPEARSRRTFAFHKPETLVEWAREAARQGVNDEGIGDQSTNIEGRGVQLNAPTAKANDGQRGATGNSPRIQGVNNESIGDQSTNIEGRGVQLNAPTADDNDGATNAPAILRCGPPTMEQCGPHQSK